MAIKKEGEKFLRSPVKFAASITFRWNKKILNILYTAIQSFENVASLLTTPEG